ncbi:LysR family transcriptional regulator [Hoeflea sp.]|uniref:LysR family transcriptional regulator n=1 Tax=Hoeflea sp. TaxID=1940281 RepID=UPI003B02114A
MQNRFKDWGDIRIFLAVMREGSTLAASRVLGINQTTVARRLDVLEQALGLCLFEKTTRGARPTDAARRLLPRAEALESAALTLEGEALAEQTRARPPIRITAFDHGMFGNIGQVVAEYVDENPGATFEFVAAERILDLSQGDADVALRLTPQITDDRLIARKVGETCWTYYASRSYADKYGTPDVYTDDMEPHRVILLNHVATQRRNVLRCAGADEIRLAIRTGQGVGPLPVFDGDRDPDLVRCFDPPEGSELPLWLVTSPEARKRPEVRRFTAFAAPRIAKNIHKVFG